MYVLNSAKIATKKAFWPFKCCSTTIILKIYFFCRKLRHTASLLKLTVWLQMSAQFLHKKECLTKFSTSNFIHDSGPFDRKKTLPGYLLQWVWAILYNNNNSSHSYHWIQYCTYCTGQPNSSYTNLDIKEKLEFANGS